MCFGERERERERETRIFLQALSRDENEKAEYRGVDQDDPHQAKERTFVEDRSVGGNNISIHIVKLNRASRKG
jgi:hypothetical protein